LRKITGSREAMPAAFLLVPPPFSTYLAYLDPNSSEILKTIADLKAGTLRDIVDFIRNSYKTRILGSEEQQSITKNIKESAYRLNLARARGPVG